MPCDPKFSDEDAIPILKQFLSDKFDFLEKPFLELSLHAPIDLKWESDVKQAVEKRPFMIPYFKASRPKALVKKVVLVTAEDLIFLNIGAKINRYLCIYFLVCM